MVYKTIVVLGQISLHGKMLHWQTKLVIISNRVRIFHSIVWSINVQNLCTNLCFFGMEGGLYFSNTK